MAILPCLLTLQVVAGQRARAATAPAVTGVSPDTGAAVGSTSVTITGSGFTGATAVDFGPVPVYGSISADSFTVVSDTEITATLGNNGDFAGTTDVTVTTPDGTSATSAADQITFVLPPTMTSISPNTGPIAGGNTVTITGTGFTDASAVTFGSTPATSFHHHRGFSCERADGRREHGHDHRDWLQILENSRGGGPSVRLDSGH